MPDDLPWSPRAYDPHVIQQNWTGRRDQVVGAWRRLAFGFPDETVYQAPHYFRTQERALWNKLSILEQKELAQERRSFIERTYHLEQLAPTRQETLIAEAESERGIFGSIMAGAGELAGAAGALPADFAGLLSILGAEGAGQSIKELVYDDPTISSGQARRRARDVMLGAYDPRYLESASLGRRDSSEVLATAVQKEAERRRLGLPTEMSEELARREVEAGQRGQAVASKRNWIESAGSVAGDVAALMLGTKGLGLAAGAAAKIPGAARIGTALGATRLGRTLASSPTAQLGARMARTGTAFGLLGAGREESWGAFPSEFAFGAGMQGAGELLAGAGGLMRARGVAGQRTLGLSPGVSTQVGTGLQQLSGKSLAPVRRGGKGASAIRAATRGAAETAKLTGGGIAAGVTDAIRDEDLTLGDAFVRALEEIPGHAVFGAFAARRGARRPISPETGGKTPTEAEIKRQTYAERPRQSVVPERRPLESMEKYRERARRAVPAVRQPMVWEQRGRKGGQVLEPGEPRVIAGGARVGRRKMEQRTKGERISMAGELEKLQRTQRARQAVASEAGREFRAKTDRDLEFQRKAQADLLGEWDIRWERGRRLGIPPEVLFQQEQLRRIARRAESLAAQAGEFKAEVASMLGQLKVDLKRKEAASKGGITKLWNKTMRQIEAIDPTLALRAQAQEVRATAKKKPEFMPPAEPVYEGLEMKPSMESKLPKERPTKGAETPLPRPLELVESEPVPGEVHREGLPLAYPQVSRQGGEAGRRIYTRHAGAAVKSHAEFLRQFEGAQSGSQAYFHARAQGEGIPRDANQIKAEEAFFTKVKAEAGHEHGTYQQELTRFQREAKHRYGKEASKAVKDLPAKGKAKDHLQSYLQDAAHGSEIGIDHQGTRDKTISAIAHHQGQFRDFPDRNHRLRLARELVRQAELQFGMHEGVRWVKIAFAMDQRARKLGVWEEGMVQPSERLLDEMVKGTAPGKDHGIYPWRTMMLDRKREESGIQVAEAALEGSEVVKVGGAGKEVKLEDRLQMGALIGYYESHGVIGPLKNAGVSGERMLTTQQHVANGWVELGLVERGATEFEYRFTKRGQEMVNDFQNWLDSNKKYHKVSPEYQPPWHGAIERPWDVRCLSPCGASDGNRAFVEATGKYGLHEGEIDRVIDHDRTLNERILGAVKGSWKRIKKGLSTDPLELNWYHLTKTVEADPANAGWIKKTIRNQFQPFFDAAPRVVLTGEREATRWLLRRKQIEDFWTTELGKEWVNDKSFVDGKSKPEFERVIEVVEIYGKMTPEERAAKRAELGEEDWNRVEVIRSGLAEIRKDIMAFLYDPIREALKRGEGTDIPLDSLVGVDLRAILPNLVQVDGWGEHWDHKKAREFFAPENRFVVEQVLQVKEQLDPGAVTFVKMGDTLLRVEGYGVADYFPHNWMRYNQNVFADQQFRNDIADTTPATFEGIETTAGHLRVANSYARDAYVPQGKRRKFVSNWLPRRMDAEGYLKHPAVLMMYLRESYRKIQYERVMRLGEDEILGEYKPLDMSSPKNAALDLDQSLAATTTQSRSHVAGHTVGGNMMLEVRGFFPKRYRKRFSAKGPWVFYVVKNQTQLGMREEADSWTNNDTLVLHQPGPANVPSNYITLRGKEIARLKPFVRKGGFLQGLTGPIENTSYWTRLEEIARGGGPKDWKARRGFFWRTWETIEMTLGALGHHAALGGVVNSPAFMMNALEGNLVLNAATNGFTSIAPGWKAMRGFGKAIVPRIPDYWKMAAEGKSHKQMWDELARSTLEKDPNNEWAKNYQRILARSPYDMGGMHEKNMWAVDVVQGHADKSESAVTAAMVDARNMVGEWVAKHYDPKAFTSFELSEQHTRQMNYMVAYDQYLARYGLAAGKGSSPYINPQTGEHYRVVEGESVKRKGTPDDPHLMSAHDLAYGQVMRTHFIYKLAYHPGIMRYRPWRMLGHLGSFGFLMAMERARDLRAMWRVPFGTKNLEASDYAHFKRGISHTIAATALYTFLNEVMGMDTGNMIGSHLADLPGLSELSWVHGIPNWVRFLPGGLPAGASTMPAKMGLGALWGAGGVVKETKGLGILPALGMSEPGQSLGDAISSQVRKFQEQNRTFFLPFDGAMAIPGNMLTIPFSRSIVGRMGQLIGAEKDPYDPEKPLRFGPAQKPVHTTYGEMLARAIFPGSPTSWTEGWRTSRYREGDRITRQYIRDDLSQRFFRATTNAEREQIILEAERMGLGDAKHYLRSLRQRLRLQGWSPRVRSYSLSDPIHQKLRNAIEDAHTMSAAERAKVHELIWGKGTPLSRLRLSKIRPFRGMAGINDLMDRYVREFMLAE